VRNRAEIASAVGNARALLFYPVWGYLYDRFARARLLALASLLWGATTWLNAIAPAYRAFLVTRASTGIDDSSYPGIYSLIADYFSARGAQHGHFDPISDRVGRRGHGPAAGRLHR
jgi:MFS family permease